LVLFIIVCEGRLCGGMIQLATRDFEWISSICEKDGFEVEKVKKSGSSGVMVGKKYPQPQYLC
jgi:hypothetical protein